MQSIAEIHSHIKSEYRRMQNEHKNKLESNKELLYSLYPRVEEIDNEISMLAITSAKRVLEEKISPEEATAQMKKKAEELKLEKAHILKTADYPQLTVKYNCDICQDTGYTENGNKCRCYMRKLQDLITLPGEVPNSLSNFFKESVFENFKLSYYPDELDPTCGYEPRKMMKMNLARCIKFSDEFKGVNSGNILLYGASGLGKSFMAACIYNRVSDRGYHAMYKSSYKLFQFLEDYKFGRVGREEYSIVYNSVYECDLLIIDDFGTEFITSYTQSVFFDLLNTRLLNGKSTVVSTNLTFDKLRDIYQDRVASRLQNEFMPLYFCGKDIRSIKNG